MAPDVPRAERDRAFDELYRLYAPDVYRYVLALLRNPADAEDVTQTTFMNAYRALSRGERVQKPQNWLIKIAHNVARTRFARASRRVREVPLEDHVAQLAVFEEEKPDIAAVLEALGRLPLNQRAALVMRELEGRAYAEIGDTLGVSVAAVETLIYRARRSLRLKASTLRILSTIPLPPTLAQLFESPLVVAGGGAVAGGGLLLKAAIALIAGAVVVATGGGSTKPAVAAGAKRPQAGAHAPAVVRTRAHPSSDLARAATSRRRGSKTRHVRHEVTASPARAVHRIRTDETATAEANATGATATSSAPAPSSATAPSTSTSQTTSTPAPSTSTPVQQATDVVNDVTQTVQQDAQQVADVVNGVTQQLPVPVPTVTVPPLPKLP